MENIYIKREKNVFLPDNMLFGVGIFPAHATRDDESLFVGLTIEDANKLKEVIPDGTRTGDAALQDSLSFRVNCLQE
jgi:hypothetical protein